MMKKLFIISIVLCCVSHLYAQTPAAGTYYYLPKTVLHFSFQVEKTTYTPGEFAQYAGKHFKRNDISLDAQVSHRIIAVTMRPEAMPDTSKFYRISQEPKYNIGSIEIDKNGVLLAVNAKPAAQPAPTSFVPTRRPNPLEPHEYMSQEILAAGSSAKMAELIAKEIYDIRENRSLLTKGQADFMPKDGEQLRIMLQQLDTQERALSQVFEGITVKDTSEVTLTFTPIRPINKQQFFRFSTYFGLTAADDLSGTPYYISIEDEHTLPALKPDIEAGKKEKEGPGIYVNLPGKARITLYRETARIAEFESYLAQFGRAEALTASLFGKKTTTRLVLNPLTGYVESLATEVHK